MRGSDRSIPTTWVREHNKYTRCVITRIRGGEGETITYEYIYAIGNRKGRANKKWWGAHLCWESRWCMRTTKKETMKWGGVGEVGLGREDEVG